MNTFYTVAKHGVSIIDKVVLIDILKQNLDENLIDSAMEKLFNNSDIQTVNVAPGNYEVHFRPDSYKHEDNEVLFINIPFEYDSNENFIRFYLNKK